MKGNIIVYYKKLISAALIFTLLINTMVSSGFAALFDDNYRQTFAGIQEGVSAAVHRNINDSFDENIKYLIEEKYREMISSLEQDIHRLETEMKEGSDYGKSDISAKTNKSEHLSNEIKKSNSYEKAKIATVLNEKKSILKKMSMDIDGLGKMYAIESLLFGNPYDFEDNAAISEEDEAYYQENKEEIEEFEENYIYGLYNEMMAAAKYNDAEFLAHTYKLMPYLKGKSGKKWYAIKSDLRDRISRYAKYLVNISPDFASQWPRESSLFVKMLPYIREEIAEEDYIKILELAHKQLKDMAQNCYKGNDCDKFLKLLNQESFLYLEGEEYKYSAEINTVYQEAIRKLISKLALAERNYEDYPSIVSAALNTYINLKKYDLIADIILLNNNAELISYGKQGAVMDPSIVIDATTYSNLINSVTYAREFLTSYPVIPHLPSLKGNYTDENGDKGNIWWDLGEILKEDGSQDAQELLKDLLSRTINSRFIANQDETANLSDSENPSKIMYIMPLLWVSALVNGDTSNVPDARRIALKIVNKSCADLTVEQEAEIDLALVRKFSLTPDELSEGAVVSQEARKFKKNKLDNKESLENTAHYVNIATIVIGIAGLARSIVVFAAKGSKLGVAMYRTLKASRMMPNSAKQIAYIRKNINSIKYYKAWKSNRAGGSGTRKDIVRGKKSASDSTNVVRGEIAESSSVANNPASATSIPSNSSAMESVPKRSKTATLSIDEIEASRIDDIKQIVGYSSFPEESYIRKVIDVFDQFNKGQISKEKAIATLKDWRLSFIKPGEEKSAKFIEQLFADRSSDARVNFLDNLAESYRLLGQTGFNQGNMYFYLRNSKIAFEVEIFRMHNPNVKRFSQIMGNGKITLSLKGNKVWTIGKELEYENMSEIQDAAKQIYSRMLEGFKRSDVLGGAMQIRRSELRITSAEIGKSGVLDHIHIEIQLKNSPYDINFRIPVKAAKEPITSIERGIHIPLQ